jgi:H+/Cl- antiporter ClcA
MFTITTYGVWCPAGLFLPGIIMGGSMGRFYTVGMQRIQGYTDNDEVMQNTVLGAASMLVGYCRLTYSLAVLMLETTQSVNLFIPMFITIMISYLTGLLFNQSLYLRALRAKQVPYLRHSVPSVN